jgi:hypothetical protein
MNLYLRNYFLCFKGLVANFSSSGERHNVRIMSRHLIVETFAPIKESGLIVCH